MRLAGKVIAVTGAGSGIGRALALELARAGAKVAGFDLRKASMDETAAMVRKDGGSCLSFAGDVAIPADADAFLEAISAEYGTVDGLINNAGIIQPFLPFAQLTRDQIDRVFRVNWGGVLTMTQAFLPKLQERTEAVIVNVSSMGGFCPVPGQGIYGASKAAVKLFSESLALELDGTGVTVITVFPGGVRTSITENAPDISESEKKRFREMSGTYGLTPEKAARTIANAIVSGKQRMMVGSDATVLDGLTRLAPRMAGKIMGALIRRAGALSSE